MLVRQVGYTCPDRGSMNLVQRRQWLVSRGVRPLGLLQFMQKLQNLIELLLWQRSDCVAYLIYRQFLAHFNQPLSFRTSQPQNIIAETGLYVHCGKYCHYTIGVDALYLVYLARWQQPGTGHPPPAIAVKVR